MDSQSLEFKVSMVYEKNRLATFKSRVFDKHVNCSAKKLAEAGFYFVGNEDDPDEVQCFFCNEKLSEWKAEEDPWQEHLSHAPDCEFAKMQRPEDALLLKELIKFKYDVMKRYILDMQKNTVEQFEVAYKNKLETLLAFKQVD